MITKFNQYKLITEDPDYIYINDDESYSLSEDDALPFLCSVNKDETKVKQIYLGSYGDYHSSINDELPRNKRAYPGRLWLNGKILSFWVYPNVELFKSIIRSLENELNIKIFNNGWRMEIIRKGGEIKRKKDYEDLYMNTGGYEDAEIIPIEEYVGSEDFPEELRIQHMMNWKEKEEAIKKGELKVIGGSHKTAWDAPHNIKYRQAIYQEKKKN